ncbi:hypothetical protein [Mucilaginibacter sp.]|uniref:hypothetical protein n=1 Tax=Mucilaginibacter sp. TaxID=1882438 RepID=UPI002621F1E9|nr:hypothetical protein [Mucilaginibacter sp.]MDB5031329.1 hypothetical protein [Mucilaginibacter sp.]
MRITKLKYLLGVLIVIGMFACKNKSDKKEAAHVFKGLYSLGPEAKIFKDCADGHEYWVTDSSKQLELKYGQLVPFEKPNEPVYVEAEGKIVTSDKNDDGGHKGEEGYNNTLIVTKIITITKDIPKGCKL